MKELGELTAKAVEDAAAKRLGPKQLEGFDAETPILPRYEWMVPPRDPRERVEVPQKDMGKMAQHLELDDFKFAAPEMVPRNIETMRVSQKPVKRCEAILDKYGVKIRGLVSFKMAVQCLAPCLAKESRISDGAASSPVVPRHPAPMRPGPEVAGAGVSERGL